MQISSRTRTTARLWRAVVVASFLAVTLTIADVTPAAGQVEETLQISGAPDGPVTLGATVALDVAVTDATGVPIEGSGAYLRVAVDPELHVADAMTAGGRPCTVGTDFVTCPAATAADPVHAMHLELDAVEINNDVTIRAAVLVQVPMVPGLWIEYLAESVEVDIVDPSIGADVHPSVTGPGNAAVGSTFTVEGAVVVAGVAAMDDVVVDITAGAGVVVTSATHRPTGVPGATSCTIVTGGATCALGTVPGHSDRLLVVSLRADSADAASTTTIEVTSSTPQDEPDPHPDVQALTIPIVAPAVAADLGVALHPDELGGPVVDEPYSPEIVVTNDGPDPVPELTLDLSLPDHYDRPDLVAPATRAALDCSGPSTAQTCTVSPGTGRSGTVLDPGEELVLGVQTVPRSELAATFHVAVGAPVPEPDGATAPNTAVLELSAAAPPVDPNPDVTGIVGSVSGPGDLGGVLVRAYAEGDALVPSGFATTTDSGDFVLELPAGEYRLLFAPPSSSNLAQQWSGGASTRAGAETVVVTDGEATTVSEQLTAASRLAGLVVDSVGVPVPHVSVSVFATGTYVAAGHHAGDASGAWSIDDLAPGTYRIRLRSPQRTVWMGDHGSTAATVDLAAGQTVDDLAPVFPVTRIHGTVTGPGDVRSTAVGAYRDGDGLDPSAFLWITEPSGSFTMDVAPGTYRIVYLPDPASGMAPQWSGGQQSRTTAEAVVVEDGNAVVTTEALVESPGLSGTVVDAGGAGVAGVQVGLYRPGAWVATRATVSDASGAFSFDWFPAGAYRVRLHDPSSGRTWWVTESGATVPELFDFAPGERVDGLEVQDPG